MVKSIVNDYSRITYIKSYDSKILQLKDKNKKLKKENKCLQQKIQNEYVHIDKFKTLKSNLQRQMKRMNFNNFSFSRKKRKIQDIQEEEVEQEEEEEVPQEEEEEKPQLQEEVRQIYHSSEEVSILLKESVSDKLQSFLLLMLVISIIFAVLTNDTTHLFKYLKSFVIMFEWNKFELSEILSSMYRHTGFGILVATLYYTIVTKI